MPDPINASVNSSVYDPNQQLSEAGCDPATMSCGPAVPVVTIPPVVIEGDASRQELVQGYDKRQAPECRTEKDAAIYACAAATVSVAAFAVTLPTGVGAVFTAGAAAVSADNCRRLINVYDECKDLGAARTAAAISCEARGGMPVSGVDKDEIACLMVDK